MTQQTPLGPGTGEGAGPSGNLGETKARAVVKARENGRCGICGAPGTDWSHRVAAGRGGLWLAENGVWLDRRCHSWLEHHPDAARVLGHRVDTGEHPGDVPVWLKGVLGPGWYLLLEGGGVTRLWDREDVPELPGWAA